MTFTSVLDLIFGRRPTPVAPRRPQGRPRNPLIADRNRDIAARYRGDEPLQSIAISYGISKERARQIARAANVPARHNKRPTPVVIQEPKRRRVGMAYEKAERQRRVEAATALVKGGMSKAKAAKKMKLSINALAGIKSKHGRWRPNLVALRAEAVALYRDTTLPAELIAKDLGVSLPFIYDAVHAAGVQLRRARAKSHMVETVEEMPVASPPVGPNGSPEAVAKSEALPSTEELLQEARET